MLTLLRIHAMITLRFIMSCRACPIPIPLKLGIHWTLTGKKRKCSKKDRKLLELRCKRLNPGVEHGSAAG